MENNDLEKTQSSLDFQNEELSIFNQDEKVSKIVSDFKPAEIKENAKVVLEQQISISSETEIIEEKKAVAEEKINNILQADICPECPEALVFEEGCQKCYSCGYSKC